MTEQSTLIAKPRKARLSHGARCTAVSVSTPDGTQAIVCKEDLVPETPQMAAPAMAPAPSCKRTSKHGRCLGRPRGSSPKNVRYATKRGRTPKQPTVTSCPIGQREWVDVTVGGGKKAKRCRCVAQGNKRYLKSSECR